MIKKEMQRFRGFFFNLILIWLIFFIYKIIPYYQRFLRNETYSIIFYLCISYSIIGLLYYFFAPFDKIKTTKGELILNLILKSAKLKFKLTKEEKTAFFFVLVKVFFLPIMLNFLIQNFSAFIYQIPNLNHFSQLFTIKNFNIVLFPFLLTAIFFIDTLWFSFGYSAEAGFLKNKIRSVEPTILGWAVALACYPPFNGFLTKYIDWFANDYVLFSNEMATFFIRFAIIFLLSIYVGATLALGTRCSNLTNRGIVTKFPYSIIRHPAYISKNLAWWLTIIPVFSLPAFFSMSAWSLIYHLRTITEEKHLSKDIDYAEYKKKVRWRYIPGVY